MRKIKWIMDNRPLIIVAICFLLIFAPYVCKFGTNELSDCHSVWAEFGDYLSGTVALISALLIYLTYRDQCVANRRESFERLLYRKIDTIVQLQKTNETDINNLSKDLLKPFFISEGDKSLNTYPVRCIELALKRIYSYYTMNRDNSEENTPQQKDKSADTPSSIKVPKSFIRNSWHIDGIEGMLQYIGSVLLYIRDYPPIGNRNDYYTEVRTLLTDNTKVIMFYYTVSKTDNILYQILKENGFFKFQQMENELLLSVVDTVCKGKSLIRKASFDNNSTTIDDATDELVESNNFLEIVDNYYRLSNKKNVLL